MPLSGTLLLTCIHMIHVIQTKNMAANDHLLTLYLNQDPPIIMYQCTSIVSAYYKIRLTPPYLNPVILAIGNRQTEHQMYFVIYGFLSNPQNNPAHYGMQKISVQCNASEYNHDIVLFNSRKDTLDIPLVLDVSPDGRFALSFTEESLVIFDLITLQNFSQKFFDWEEKFRPGALKISNKFIFIAGYSENVIDLNKLYLLTLTSDYKATIIDEWSTEKDIRNIPFYSLSVTDDDGTIAPRILLRITYPAGVHLLTVNQSAVKLEYISSKMSLKAIDVAWFHQGEKAAILSDTEKKVLVYNMGKGTQFNSFTMPSEIFPNSDQPLPLFSSNSLKNVQIPSEKNTIYLLLEGNQVLILPPSQPGYFTMPKISDVNQDGTAAKNPIISYIANLVQCPIGKFKNDTSVWSCKSCWTTTNDSMISHNYPICPLCTRKEYCPWIHSLNVDAFNDVEQNQGYQKLTQIDVFDDVILYHIFRTDCGMSSPFYITLIFFMITLLFLIIIPLMKMIKRLRPNQKNLQKFLRRIDLIGQGQLWFGGLISLSVFVIIVYSSRFSYIFHRQYPLEKYSRSESSSADRCELKNVLNSKFQTSLQFISNPSPHYKQIFGLLDSQTFIFHLDVLNTQFHCAQIQLKNVGKLVYPPYTCHQNGANLHISSDLPAHKMTLNLMFYGNSTIDSIRLGLMAKRLEIPQNVAQQLHFLRRFNYSHYRLAQSVQIECELTKAINMTEGLTETENNSFTGLWVPLFSYNTDQMFVHSSIPLTRKPDGTPYPINYQTSLSFSIKETSIFIYNKQEPIARRSEIIFHTVLFINTCLGLLAMFFLLLTLWIIPMIKLFLKRCVHPNHWCFRIIFDGDNTPTNENSQDVGQLVEKLAALELRMQHNSERMEALIRNISIDNHPVVQSNSL